MTVGVITIPDIGSIIDVAKGPSKKVLVADPDAEWQQFYRDCLEGIVSPEKIIIIASRVESVKYSTEYFDAYIIEPELPQGMGKDKSDWGLDLAQRIAMYREDYNAIWLLSKNHDLLSKGRIMGFYNGYSKNKNNDDYRNAEQFKRDIRLALTGHPGS